MESLRTGAVQAVEAETFSRPTATPDRRDLGTAVIAGALRGHRDGILSQADTIIAELDKRGFPHLAQILAEDAVTGADFPGGLFRDSALHDALADRVSGLKEELEVEAQNA